ncbi:hypothetical protein C8F04DRAFT_982157, partial [Mycena alexandri]
RGQAGVTRSERNLQKANLMKNFEIAMYNRARQALIYLGHIADDSSRYPLLTARDTRRKETHLHRARGDSRLFDGTAWYLQSGQRLTTGVAASVGATRTAGAENEAPVLLSRNSGAQASKCVAPDKQTLRRVLTLYRFYEVAPQGQTPTTPPRYCARRRGGGSGRGGVRGQGQRYGAITVKATKTAREG